MSALLWLALGCAGEPSGDDTAVVEPDPVDTDTDEPVEPVTVDCTWYAAADVCWRALAATIGPTCVPDEVGALDADAGICSFSDGRTIDYGGGGADAMAIIGRDPRDIRYLGADGSECAREQMVRTEAGIDATLTVGDAAFGFVVGAVTTTATCPDGGVFVMPTPDFYACPDLTVHAPGLGLATPTTTGDGINHFFRQSPIDTVHISNCDP